MTLAPRTPLAESPAAPAVTPVATGPRSEVRGPLGLVILTDVGCVYMSGPAELREEYRDGGLRVGAQALVVPVGSLHVSFGLGYVHERGYPQFDYLTATQRDTPLRSSPNVFDVGLRIGQHAQIGDTMGRIYWGLGPAFFWVYEVARLDVYSEPSGQWLDRRFESLNRGRLGGDVAVGVSWQVAGNVHVGGQVRGFVIPWYSQGRKSLTLDFLGDRGLAGLGVSAGVTFDAF